MVMAIGGCAVWFRGTDGGDKDSMYQLVSEAPEGQVSMAFL